jgi:hypothetical protein
LLLLPQVTLACSMRAKAMEFASNRPE